MDMHFHHATDAKAAKVRLGVLVAEAFSFSIATIAALA
jgi:hypothetical protein